LKPDPYEVLPNPWERHRGWLTPLTVGVLTVVLFVVSFPPYHAPEAAYTCLIPGIFWAYLRPRFWTYAWTVLAAQSVAWTINLAWLHPVTWAGLFLLGPIVGVWTGCWYLAVWWAMPRILGRPKLVRIFGMLGLAGLWVVIEWTRTWLFGGFPWMPLAATQWERVSVLQIAAYTGAYGVSFVLVSANIGFSAFAHRVFREGETGFRKRSPELLLALFMLLVCLAVHVQESVNRGQFQVPFARVAFVQPDIPSPLKWSPAESQQVVRTLVATTVEAGATRPDVILWPESTLPWALRGGDPSMKAFVEQLSARVRTPLLIGADAIEHPDSKHEKWYNAAFVVDPKLGVQTAYYAKRRLVQFGEYIPLRPVFGWIGKFAPLGDDFSAHRPDAERFGRLRCPHLLRGPVPGPGAGRGPFRGRMSGRHHQRLLVRGGRRGLPARGPFRASGDRIPPPDAAVRRRWLVGLDRRIRKPAQGAQERGGKHLHARNPDRRCDAGQPLGGPEHLLRRAWRLVCFCIRLPGLLCRIPARAGRSPGSG
jgi:apolipoprotein N-acyltransferase